MNSGAKYIFRVSGTHYSPGKFPKKSPNPNAYDEVLGRNVYEGSMKLVGLA